MSKDAAQFWIDRGNRGGDAALSVTPSAKHASRVAWARARLQNWTLEGLHRHGACFDHYVDLGCGFGDFTAVLGREAKQITACDVSPRFVEATRERLAAMGRSDAQVYTSDVRGFLDYQGATVIYLGGVLTYLDDEGVAEVLRGVNERLVPGGLIAARDWCAMGFARERQRSQPWFSVHRRPERYVSLFREAGFELIEEASSLIIYAEQVPRELIHHERRARAAAWLPRIVARAATSLVTSGSVTFFFRRIGEA